MLRSLADLNERFLCAWRDLEEHSVSGNPFQSPSYVLAAARHLPEVAAPVILTVESQGELQGLCVFESVAGTRRLPIRHLRAWQSPHTYFDVPLLRIGSAERSMEEFWNFMVRGTHEWHGVEFPRFPNQDPVTRILDETAHADRIPCVKGSCWERASLELRACNSEAALQQISIKRAKSLRRGWRELEKQGEVHFEVQRNPQEMIECADELMHLESLGWKSAVGTALASQPAHRQFFREMVTSLSRRENVFFTRILLNGRAIASVAHLLANGTAYAFKLGWDPAMERGCPGYQVKLHTAVQGQAQLPDVQRIDSCSSPGSFIEHVWSHRRSFCNRVYVTSPVGNFTATMLTGIRWMRNKSRAVSRRWLNSDSQSGSSSCADG